MQPALQCIWAATAPNLTRPPSTVRIQAQIEAVIPCAKANARPTTTRLLSPSANSSRHSILKITKTKSKTCLLVWSRYSRRILPRLSEVVLILALKNKTHHRRSLYRRLRQTCSSFKRRNWAVTAITKPSQQLTQIRSAKHQQTMKPTATSKHRRALSMESREATRPKARFKITFNKLSKSNNYQRIKWISRLLTLQVLQRHKMELLLSLLKTHILNKPVRPSKWCSNLLYQVKLHQTAAKWWIASPTCWKKRKWNS